MTQKNKYRVIAEFTGKYSITVMCKFMSVPRSSYYYWLKNKDCEDKDASFNRINQRRPTCKLRNIRI